MVRPVAQHVAHGATIKHILSTNQRSRFQQAVDIRFWKDEVYSCEINSQSISEIVTVLRSLTK